MDFGPEGALFAAVQGHGEDDEKKIVRIDPETKEITTVATRVNPNDLVVSRAGHLYFTDTQAGTVVRAPLTARGMSRPPSRRRRHRETQRYRSQPGSLPSLRQ